MAKKQGARADTEELAEIDVDDPFIDEDAEDAWSWATDPEEPFLWS
jgi:hypothetical protein